MHEPAPVFAMRPEMRLLVLIARTEDTFEPVLTALIDAGIAGATVIESRGLGAVIRSELPIFTGLAALLPPDTGGRVLISITSQASIDTLLRHLLTLPVDARPVGAVLPLQGVIGLG
jgi:hypothetical protein